MCACMHVHATEWGAGSWSMVVLTDLGDVASRTGQQLTVLRIRVTCSAPSASRSDDILSLMSKVSMTVSEPAQSCKSAAITGALTQEGLCNEQAWAASGNGAG